MPNYPNQSAHDAAPSTPQLPLCLDRPPLAPGARSWCCQGTPAGRAGLAAGPLRTCSRPPLGLCRVLFLFYSRPSRPPPLCERRRITLASRHQNAVRDTPDAILTRRRSTTTSTRRPAERPHILSHCTLWSASAVSFPNSGRRITTQISLAWTPRPIGDDQLAARYLIYLSGRPDWSIHWQTQHLAVSLESDLVPWPGPGGWDSPPARPTTEKLDGSV